MTKSQPIILALPIDRLKQSSAETKESLTLILNKGYEKPAIEYKIVLSPRIASGSSFFADLGFNKSDDKCFFYIMMDPSIRSDPEFRSQFFNQNTSAYDTDNFFGISDNILNFKFPLDKTLATIGYKHLDSQNYEVVGFTSFKRGAGIKIFEISMEDFTKRFGATKLVANVIVEHNLVSYYEKKLGFTEIHRTLVEKDKPESSGFQDTFNCSQDIHISCMEKPVEIL